MRRQIESIINDDLQRKMVFLSGPRQAGKTWLSKKIMACFSQSLYLNWDNPEHRNIIRNQAWSKKLELLVFDEIHKMDTWKSYVKGIWDTRPEHTKILVTGSARLETFRQSGDSLAGRYFHHRLLPITPEETTWAQVPTEINDFLTLGGFPEPYLEKSPLFADRWRSQYLNGLIREDILQYDNINHLKEMNMLVELLRSRVASPLSYQSLSEDIGISPNTVKKYIHILEALYIIFLIFPYSKSISRSLVKPPKLYFFDIPLVRDPGARLENLVALSLLRRKYLLEDSDGIPRSLHYLKTKEGKEVDFLWVKDYKPEKMFEVKASDPKPSKSLIYFHKTYGFPATQLVGHLHIERYGNVDIRDLFIWLKNPEVT